MMYKRTLTIVIHSTGSKSIYNQLFYGFVVYIINTVGNDYNQWNNNMSKTTNED